MPQLPGAGKTWAHAHHGSHTPTSSGAVLLGKMAYHTKQIRRQCRASMASGTSWQLAAVIQPAYSTYQCSRP